VYTDSKSKIFPVEDTRESFVPDSPILDENATPFEYMNNSVPIVQSFASSNSSNIHSNPFLLIPAMEGGAKDEAVQVGTDWGAFPFLGPVHTYRSSINLGRAGKYNGSLILFFNTSFDTTLSTSFWYDSNRIAGTRWLNAGRTESSFTTEYTTISNVSQDSNSKPQTVKIVFDSSRPDVWLPYGIRCYVDLNITLEVTGSDPKDPKHGSIIIPSYLMAGERCTSNDKKLPDDEMETLILGWPVFQAAYAVRDSDSLYLVQAHDKDLPFKWARSDPWSVLKPITTQYPTGNTSAASDVFVKGKVQLLVWQCVILGLAVVLLL
jgi:hypothetical protein